MFIYIWGTRCYALHEIRFTFHEIRPKMSWTFKPKPEKFIWSPQPGPQVAALDTRKWCDELLYGGGRGAGKSEYLLMDFAVDVPEFGDKWHGIIFRRTYPQLDEIVKRSQEIYPKLYGRPLKEIWREGDYSYKLPHGSTLKLRHLDRDADVFNYHGHEYGFIGWDEITHWPTDGPYKKMFATLRSPHKIYKRVRVTGNPGGPGTAWVKRRFVDLYKPGSKLFRENVSGMTRMYIKALVTDNQILLKQDPGYIGRLKASCMGNPQLLRAWLYGNWDVFFGQFFGMFDPNIHKADPLQVFPSGSVPPNWRIEGSLDYGESKPTVFLLWATNEKGESYLIAEYYKAGLWLNEHAAGIFTLCHHCPYTNGRMPERIWADPQIFYTRASANAASMNRMVSDVFKSYGLKLVKSNRDRINGWRFLKNQLAWKRDQRTGKIIQMPKLYYFPECDNFERTFIDATYAGTEDNPSEDLDTECDDHVQDAARYFVMGSHKGVIPKEEKAENGLNFDYHLRRMRLERLGVPIRDVPMIPVPRLVAQEGRRRSEFEESVFAN